MPRLSIAFLILTFLMRLSAVAHAQDTPFEAVPVFGEALQAELSPDGRLVATYENSVALNDEVNSELLPIRIYDLSTGEEVAALEGQLDYAVDVAFSPDGETLASLHWIGYLNLWDVATGDLLNQIPITQGGGVRVEFLPDGRSVVLIQPQPPGVQVWDTDTGAMTRILYNHYENLQEYRDAVQNVPENAAAYALSPDGTTVALATSHGRIWLWNLETGEPTLAVNLDEEFPTFPIRNLRFTADGARLVYTNTDTESIVALDLATLEPMVEVIVDDLRIPYLAISPDGDTVVWIGGEERDRLYTLDLDEPESQRALEGILEGTPTSPPVLLFTPDGSRVIVAGFRSEDDRRQSYLYVVPVD